MQVSSTAALHEALRSAGPDQVIELAPGEYRGPFVLDRPAHIKGQGGRRTVLWCRAGPVIYVRSIGVRLERLLVERTVLAGPPVVHRPGCLPAGKESVEINTEALIDLGDLVPGSSVTVPLTVDVPSRTVIEVTGLYGASISPAVLEAPGSHVVHLRLEGASINRGDLLLGELTLKAGESTRYIWLTGMALDGALPDRPLCLVMGKTQLLPSAGGLALNESLFAALGADGLGGDYGTLQRDPSGAAVFVLSAQPPTPILINGSPLHAPARRLIRETDAVQVGPLAFDVKPADAPLVSLEGAPLKFADFTANIPEPASLTVKPEKNGWRGQLLAGVPWLTVEPEGYFRVPPSRPRTWTVTLNALALDLPDGDHHVHGGVLVEGERQLLGVDVHLKVQRPAVALQAEPVDFGVIELGWNEGRTVDIAVVNAGREAWTGQVRANVPWLEVVAPSSLGSDAWAQTALQVRFVPRWESLSPGVRDYPGALTVVPAKGETLSIPFRLEVLPAKGHLTPALDFLEFPEVERGGELPELTFSVENKGGATWKGTVKALFNWVAVEPETLEVPAGEAADLQARLLAVPEDQPLNTPLLVDSIRFDADSESAPVPNALPVHLTIIERPPFLSARPVNFAPFVKGDTPPDAVLSVVNLGPAAWHGKAVSNALWLSVPDREFSCAPHETAEINIGLNALSVNDLPAGVTRWEAALAVTGGRSPVNVPVQIDVRDTPTDLILETPVLSFGLVSDTIARPPEETLRLLNASPTPWKGHVALRVPWLSFESVVREFELEIPKMSTAEIKVLANEHLMELPPGVVAEEPAIAIRGPHKMLNVRAMLVLAESQPWLVVSPRRLIMRNEGPASLIAKNEGARRWMLQISAAAWLDVPVHEITLAPGEARTLEVRLAGEQANRASANGATLDDPRAIVIYGPGREIEVGVEATANALSVLRERLDREAAARVPAPQPSPGAEAPPELHDNGTDDEIHASPESPAPDADLSGAFDTDPKDVYAPDES
jgi:hypothetical protein